MPCGTHIKKETSRDTGLPTIYITPPGGSVKDQIAIRFIQ